MNAVGIYSLLLQLVNLLIVDAVSYNRCRIYRVYEKELKDSQSPISRLDLKVLKQHKEVDHANNRLNVKCYLVPEFSENDFLRAVDDAGAKYKVLVHDLGQDILEEKESVENYQRKGFAVLEGVTHTYYSYDEMIDFLKQISEFKNPIDSTPLAVIEPVGTSFEKRPLTLVKISSDHSAKKPIIFLEAGIHAREWTAPSTALCTIYRLVRNYTHNSEALNDVDYYIMPLANPDGYEFSRTKDRLWRKTRSYYRGHYGVDGNRNYDFHWGEAGTSTSPESDIFHGPQPFSEPETRSIRDAGEKYKDRIVTFVSIHSYGSYIVYPWGYTTVRAPQSGIMAKISLDAIEAIKKHNGTTFKQGTSSVALYPAAGGSDDYFKGVLGVNLSFTMEVTSPTRSFIVPGHHIQKIADEAFEGFKVIASSALNYHRRKLVL